ncbi:MAG: hypothetical protein LBD58_02075 [Treponema sp.]|nr:hypothetical protein [Treponema sp.]
MEELEKLKADFAAQNERLVALQKENAELKSAGKKAESEAYFGRLRDEGKSPRRSSTTPSALIAPLKARRGKTSGRFSPELLRRGIFREATPRRKTGIPRQGRKTRGWPRKSGRSRKRSG